MLVANTPEAQSNFKVFSALLDSYQEPVLRWAKNIEDILEVRSSLSAPDIDTALDHTIVQLKAYGHHDSLKVFAASKENLLAAAAWLADITPYGDAIRDLWLKPKQEAYIKDLTLSQ